MADINAQIKQRQSSNRVIVQLISDMVEQNPNLRFHQILHILGVEIQHSTDVTKDLFNEESVITLERMSQKVL